jgi:hypothetical protein
VYDQPVLMGRPQMIRELTYGLAALLVVFHTAAGAAAAQAPGSSSKPPADESKEIRLNGCISRDATRPGQFNFRDNESGDRYRLTGKGLRKFVGHRVEIVGGPPGKGITFRTGLWPSPNVAAQAGALDPAKAAVANLPGGAADAPGVSPLPELKVIRLRGVEGACQ